MIQLPIAEEQIRAFGRALAEDERSPGTIEKYLRDVRAFAAWLGGCEPSKERTAAWRENLLASGYAPVTVNSMLSAVNRFFRFLGMDGCRAKFLCIQRRVFREPGRELTRQDYSRLVGTAQSLGQSRLALLMETICSTGIRVSELRFVTVEAAGQGRTEIRLKGKIRTILFPDKLRRKLLRFAKKEKIASGEIFRTRAGKSISRQQVWREMKHLCKIAGVEPSRVFPHNLRHLFASVFYQSCRDIVQLADLLGHSSINTTRLYLLSTGADHARRLERLGLVS